MSKPTQPRNWSIQVEQDMETGSFYWDEFETKVRQAFLDSAAVALRIGGMFYTATHRAKVSAFDGAPLDFHTVRVDFIWQSFVPTVKPEMPAEPASDPEPEAVGVAGPES